MQVGIPVAYNVCEVKLDKINHWIYVHIEDFPVAMARCCSGVRCQIRHTASRTQNNCYINPKSNGLALVPITYLFVFL